MALTGTETLYVQGYQANGLPGASTEATTTSAIAQLASGASLPPASFLAVTAAAGTTLTAANLLTRYVYRSGPSAAFTDTTDTAANIVAALTNPTVGESFSLEIINTTAFPETIAAGTGVTLNGLAGPIPANSTVQILVVLTSLSAITMSLVRTTYNATNGYEPSTVQTQFGSSVATFLEEGNINRQITAAGISPGGTGADYVLAVYSLPANAFDVLGRGVNITAAGSFAATANNKTVKIIFNATTAVVGSTVTGGTTICSTGVVATSGSGWQVQGLVFKYGAAGSNTQMGIHDQAQTGAAVGAMLAPSLITATESGAILIAITGNAATATSDIVANFLQIGAMN